MNEDLEDSPRLRGLLNTTLTGEPPLVDLVHRAASDARRRKQRDRIAMGVAPLAVLALAVGAYKIAPNGRGGTATPGNAVYTTSTSHQPPVFPPVSPTSPVNATPAVHQASVQFCGNVKNDYAGNMNVVPQTDEQAVSLCQMTMDMVGTLFPDATASFPVGSHATWGELNEVVLTTKAGASKLSMEYIWPAKDKGEYHVDQFSCDDVLHPATTYQDSTMPINPAMIPHDETCLYTSPAPRLQAMYTTSMISGDVGYDVNDTQGGHWGISTGADLKYASYQIGNTAYPSAYTGEQWSKAFLDPRFGAYLRDYADFVLSHSAMKWPQGITFP